MSESTDGPPNGKWLQLPVEIFKETFVDTEV